jgi:hypothetical protein
MVVSNSYTKITFLPKTPLQTYVSKPSRDHKAKLALSTHADHQRREMALKDPKAQLTAELVLRCRRLQEQFPGMPTLAMSRKQAQSGCRLWPHQLLDGS